MFIVTHVTSSICKVICPALRRVCLNIEGKVLWFCGVEPRRSLLPSIPERPMRRLAHTCSSMSMPDDASCSDGAHEPSQDVHAPAELSFPWGESQNLQVSAEAAAGMPSPGVTAGLQHVAPVVTPGEGSERRPETNVEELMNEEDGMPPANLAVAAEAAGESNECAPSPSSKIQVEGNLGGSDLTPGDLMATTHQQSSSDTKSSHASVFCRHGLSSFRMEPNPAKRAKLESFDRKIGRQPTLVQVCMTPIESSWGSPCWRLNGDSCGACIFCFASHTVVQMVKC